MTDRCAFCSDPASTGEIVFENDIAWVILHDDWSVRGHAMVVAKQHVENVADLDEWPAFAELYQRAERVLLDLTGAERAIILKLGIQTPHLHLHIYPVSATADRAAVFAAIEGKTKVERDEGFVAALAERLGARPW